MVHGMGFGALYLLACSGAMVELWRGGDAPDRPRDDAFLRVYLVTMAVLAWLAVLSGAYIVYPWYRAAAPAGIASLAGYPQRLLQSSPATAGWHSIGMEWKEHVAWLAPISITMAAGVFSTYGRRGLSGHPQLRKAVLSFVLVSFLSAGIAGFFGAMLNKRAPVDGGAIVHVAGGR
jgi:hypothetical protein